jgi:hypothetical protein
LVGKQYAVICVLLIRMKPNLTSLKLPEINQDKHLFIRQTIWSMGPPLSFSFFFFFFHWSFFFFFFFKFLIANFCPSAQNTSVFALEFRCDVTYCVFLFLSLCYCKYRPEWNETRPKLEIVGIKLGIPLSVIWVCDLLW